MRRAVIILIAAAGLVFAGSLGALLALVRKQASPTPVTATTAGRSGDPLMPDERTRDLSIPPFTLTDHTGAKFDNDIFKGRLTIVDFFFTHCNLACPVLVQRMHDQTRALRGTGVRFLSISVDPEHDTPETIARYGREHDADLVGRRWTFATGDRETIGAIITGGLKFAVGEDPKRTVPLAEGRTMPNIIHPPWFVLVGPRGEVLGIYLASGETSEDEMRELSERARAAAAKLGD